MGRLDDTLETMPYQIRKMYYIGLRKKCIEKQCIMEPSEPRGRGNDKFA